MFVVDGILYEEYPDELERIRNLRILLDNAHKTISEEIKKRWALEKEIEALKEKCG